MNDYSEILHLPHVRPKNHPSMSAEARAAQFSPFAALRGFDEEIDETARFTEQQITVGEEAQGEIADALRAIRENIGKREEVEIVYFLPDEKKEGGRYVTARQTVKKLLEAERALLLQDNTLVPFETIYFLKAIK